MTRADEGSLGNVLRDPECHFHRFVLLFHPDAVSIGKAPNLGVLDAHPKNGSILHLLNGGGKGRKLLGAEGPIDDQKFKAVGTGYLENLHIFASGAPSISA